MALLVYLNMGMEWDASTLAEVGLFVVLIIAAGSFPLPVGQGVKTDVSTAILFAAAIVLEPGAAALAGTVGLVTYTALIRFWGMKLRLPWYKYPFNAGQTALFMGLTSLVFHGLSTGDAVLSAAAVPAAVTYYLVNTTLVSCAAGLHMQVNPINVWRSGTRENGLAEVAFFAFGFLGGILYQESPWTIVALSVPIGVIYIAFFRLAQKISERERAKEELEIRVQARTSELSITNEQLWESRRRIVHACPGTAQEGRGGPAPRPRAEPAPGGQPLAAHRPGVHAPRHGQERRAPGQRRPPHRRDQPGRPPCRHEPPSPVPYTGQPPGFPPLPVRPVPQ